MNGEPTYDPYGGASETPREQDATGYSPGETPSQAPIPPPRSPGPGWWTYWDLLYLVLFAAPASLLIVVICPAVLLGLNFVFEWGLDLAAPQVTTPLAIVIQLLLWIAVFAFIYAIITLKYGLRFGPAIGWTRYEGRAVSYFSGGTVVAISATLILSFLPKPEDEAPFEALLRALLDDRISLALMGTFAILIAPVVEEMLFRGFIFSVVDRSLGAAAAVISTSLLFSLLHGFQYGWRWQSLVVLTAVGVTFGAARAWAGSVRPSALMHAGYNATMFSGLLFASDHLEKL